MVWELGGLVRPTHEANKWVLWMQDMPQFKYRIKGIDSSSGMAGNRYMLNTEMLQEFLDQV